MWYRGTPFEVTTALTIVIWCCLPKSIVDVVMGLVYSEEDESHARVSTILDSLIRGAR